MDIFVKPITYVTAHCRYFSLNMFSCDTMLLFCQLKYLIMPEKLCLLSSKNDHEMSQSQTVDQAKVP